ncbi:hypothetical protein DBV39_18975 [Orrella marina]|uniref:Uncharacterized protein n=1 Tax=Orrella marina TaxID=2163011 RepID=A0A2R4XNV6_9BURK|nr:hypothetical protein DBV39_18975 [Orrella marina]
MDVPSSTINPVRTATYADQMLSSKNRDITVTDGMRFACSQTTLASHLAGRIQKHSRPKQSGLAQNHERRDDGPVWCTGKA